MPGHTPASGGRAVPGRRRAGRRRRAERAVAASAQSEEVGRLRARHRLHGGRAGERAAVGVGRGVPEVPFTWNGTLPPYQRTPPKRCAIFVDRHVHKNGGSTMRGLLLENERLGHELYQGYTQMYWGRLFRTIRQLHSGAEAPRQLLMYEAHFGGRVPRPRAARPAAAAQAVPDCPVHTLVRIREPLEYYLSFPLGRRLPPEAEPGGVRRHLRRVGREDARPAVHRAHARDGGDGRRVPRLPVQAVVPHAALGRLDDEGRQKLLASFLDTFSTVARWRISTRRS